MRKVLLTCGLASAIWAIGIDAIAAPPPPHRGPPARGPARPPGGPAPRHYDGPSPGAALATGVLGAIIGGAIVNSVNASQSRAAPPPPAPGVERAVAVQSQLRSLGYYHGGLDGIVGSGTRRAIRRYQADYGLPRTGRIDPALLHSLGLR